MASKRRADKTESPKPTEPVREVAVTVPAPGRFDRLLARLKTLKGAVVAIAGVGAVLGGLAGYWNAYQAARSSTESSKLLALVGKGDAGPLSIVVLPFANLTGDPQQAYLADGLTAAVTSDLSRIRDAFIVSTATAFAYKDKPLTVQQIGQELGVRFALQGGVQRSGEKIRINAQLADTTTNAQLWSESFDGSQGDLFGLQEMLTTRIGISLREKMVVVAARDSETRKSDPSVADMMLRARALSFKRESKANYDERNALYRKVLLVEPNNVRAMVNLANSLSLEAHNQIRDPAAREAQLVEARDLALKAKELEPTYPSINNAITIYALAHGDFEGARRADEAELVLNPKEPFAYSNLAGDHVDLGEPAKAVELLTQAIRLDPRKVDASILRNMTVAQFMLGDDEAAIEWARKALAANPGFIGQHAFMAMSYARKGDRIGSKAAAESLLIADPTFTLTKFHRNRLATFSPGYRTFWETRLVPAWRLAGLPE